MQDPTGWRNGNKRIIITAADSGGATSAINGWMIKNTNVAPKATDGGWTGISGNGPWNTGYSYGATTWYVWVKDACGNVSAARSCVVNNIDTTKPTITIDDPPAEAQRFSKAIVGIQDSQSRISSRNIYNKLSMVNGNTN